MKQRIESVSSRTRQEKTPRKSKKKKKRHKKNEEGLREVQDNMKCNNIHIIEVQEGEEEE